MANSTKNERAAVQARPASRTTGTSAGRHVAKPVIKKGNGAGKTTANARQAADMEKKLHRAEMLLEISHTVAGFENLSEMLEKTVEIITAETGAERGTLFLNDEETGELYSRVAQGELTREIRVLNDSGIAGAAFTADE